MNKRKLAKIIGVCTMAITIVVAITILPSCDSTTPLVTLDCTDHTTNSLTAHATVNSLEAGPLSRRGFVYEEGTEGDPELNIVPLVNPSFEDGDPPTGWSTIYATGVRSTEQVKLGSYSANVTQAIAGERGFIGVALNLSEYRGKTITLGVWIWCDTADRARITLADKVGGIWDLTFSSYHPGDSEWHFLTVTRTIRTNSDDSWVQPLRIEGGASIISAYADGAVLVENAVFEDGQFGTGEYSLVITGLKPDTSYRVRAFVENEAGISYGNVVSCKTL